MENPLRTHSHYMLQFMVTWILFLKAKRTFAERIRLIVIFSLHFFFIWCSTFFQLNIPACNWLYWMGEVSEPSISTSNAQLYHRVKNYHFMQKFSFLHIVCRCFLCLLLFLTRRKMHISNEMATSLQLWHSKNVLIFNESTFIHIMIISVFLMVFHEPNYARHEMNIFI